MIQRIDTHKLIAYMGGRTPCHTAMSKAGFTISKKALEKWRERKSIPLTRLLQLVETDKKINGRVLDIQDFVVAE